MQHSLGNRLPIEDFGWPSHWPHGPAVLHLFDANPSILCLRQPHDRGQPRGRERGPGETISMISENGGFLAISNVAAYAYAGARQYVYRATPPMFGDPEDRHSPLEHALIHGRIRLSCRTNAPPSILCRHQQNARSRPLGPHMKHRSGRSLLAQHQVLLPQNQRQSSPR